MSYRDYYTILVVSCFMPFNATRIAHGQYTDIYSQIYIFIRMQRP